MAVEPAWCAGPVWPGGLWGEIKEEASAARRMPGDINPKGLQVAPGPSARAKPAIEHFPGSGRRAQTLKRKCSTSPSCTRYRSEEQTTELQSLMRISYAVFCLTKKKNNPDI